VIKFAQKLENRFEANKQLQLSNLMILKFSSHEKNFLRIMELRSTRFLPDRIILGLTSFWAGHHSEGASWHKAPTQYDEFNNLRNLIFCHKILDLAQWTHPLFPLHRNISAHI